MKGEIRIRASRASIELLTACEGEIIARIVIIATESPIGIPRKEVIFFIKRTH